MPSPSTPTVTGDVWSPSPDRRVTSTAQWLRATNARASSGLTRPPWWSARLARLNPRSRLFGGHLDPQQPEGHLDGRTDPEGEQDGTDAGRATEQHADDQHAGLDDRPDDADPQPGARRDRQHQGVPGARPEPGADVQRGAERHQEDTDDHGGQAHRQPARAQVGADAGGEHRVREDPDEHHVDQRARPGPDAGQGPRDQQDHADEDGRDPEGQGRHVADAVMEHIPGPDSQPGAQAQDHAGGDMSTPLSGYTSGIPISWVTASGAASATRELSQSPVPSRLSWAVGRTVQSLAPGTPNRTAACGTSSGPASPPGTLAP